MGKRFWTLKSVRLSIWHQFTLKKTNYSYRVWASQYNFIMALNQCESDCIVTWYVEIMKVSVLLIPAALESAPPSSTLSNKWVLK